MSWKLQSNNSIIGAELSAIKQATKWICQQMNPGNTVILTDSQTSLHLIKNRKIKAYSYNVSKIQQDILEILNRGGNIHLQWIPSHTGVEGNDIADHLANLGRSSNYLDTPVEINDLNKLIDNKMQEKWKTKWQIERQHGLFGIMKETLENWTWTRGSNRKLDVCMTRLRLRCVNLNKYLYKTNASNTDLCTKCNLQQQEDVEHYLLQCTNYTVQRNLMLNNLRLQGIHNISSNILLGASNYDIRTKRLITKELENYLKSTRRLANYMIQNFT